MGQVKCVEYSLVKKFEVICSAKTDHITANFLKTVFCKLYLVQSWILCLIVTILFALSKKSFFDTYVVDRAEEERHPPSEIGITYIV